MFTWLPLIGPILQGLGSIYTSFTNKEIAKIQAGTTVTVAETNASVQIIQATMNDICLRILRDLLILFPVVWTALIGWDTIVANHWPSLMWHVAKYPPSLSYLPYAVMVFLLGNIGLNMLSRK